MMVKINQMKKDELFEEFLFDQVSRSASETRARKNYAFVFRMRPVQSKVRNYGMPNLTM